jgi:hypothetical protein
MSAAYAIRRTYVLIAGGGFSVSAGGPTVRQEAARGRRILAAMARDSERQARNLAAGVAAGAIAVMVLVVVVLLALRYA